MAGLWPRVLQEDQEPAVKKLVRQQHPATYDHQSSGLVEGAVEAVINKMLAPKRGPETSLDKTVPVTHPLLIWLAEFAVWHLITCHLHSDGRTAYQHLRGRSFAKRVLWFVGRVQYKLPPEASTPVRTSLQPNGCVGTSLDFPANHVTITSWAERRPACVSTSGPLRGSPESLHGVLIRSSSSKSHRNQCSFLGSNALG